MRRIIRRRPEVESLESMLLLSTLVAETHHAAPPAHVAPVPGPVSLHGTIHASGHLSSTTLTLSGSGNLGRVGTASFRLSTDLANPTSDLTLSTRHGKIYLAASGPLATGDTSGSVTYGIVGGTGSYAGATGSGSIFASLGQLKGTKVSATVKFS